MVMDHAAKAGGVVKDLMRGARPMVMDHAAKAGGVVTD
jgi:hypothetical protein